MTEPRVNLEELARLLREYEEARGAPRHDYAINAFSELANAAINALPALIAEVEASRAEKFALEKWILKLSELSNKVQTEANALRVENEALRRALKLVVMVNDESEADYLPFCRICEHDWRFPHRSDCPVAVLATPADATHEQVIGGRDDAD